MILKKLKIPTSLFFLLQFFSSCSQSLPKDSWQSEKVFYDKKEKLVYTSDDQKNRIPDFSYAGYKNSESPLPNIKIVKSISPIVGDNTMHLQNAIDEIGELPLDKKGFRGALLLQSGIYEIHGTLYLNKSGVVLKGEGDKENASKNTILLAVGNTPRNREIIIAGSGVDHQWKDWIWGSRSFITSDFVQVGSRKFEVDNPSLYKVGDNIIINHPCTKKWLEANDWGGTGDNSKFWYEGEMPILYNRYIKKITGKIIEIDVPVYNHLSKELAQSFIYKPQKSEILNNIGIENLRIDIQKIGDKKEVNHAKSAIVFRGIEDGWLKKCTMLHFWKSGFQSQSTSRVTVVDCNAFEPYGVITGGQRYNFNASNASQQILFYQCNASDARHAFVSNGRATVSGISVVECTSARSYTASEGHQKWSQGMLFDNLKEIETRIETEGGNRVMGFYNRGDWANGHGWSAVNSVLWNCNANGKTIVVQKPPIGQNYAIGCFGVVTGEKPLAPFKGSIGYIEGANKKKLYPKSLFKAQYKERMGREFTIK